MSTSQGSGGPLRADTMSKATPINEVRAVEQLPLAEKPLVDEPIAEEASAGPLRLRDRFFRYVPAFDSLRTYSWRSLRTDLVAGLTVAAVALPQAMAYATIAGLPPEYGLYTAIVMTTIGALFDSSRQLINGPTNAISIAVLSAFALLPAQDKIAVA